MQQEIQRKVQRRAAILPKDETLEPLKPLRRSTRVPGLKVVAYLLPVLAVKTLTKKSVLCDIRAVSCDVSGLRLFVQGVLCRHGRQQRGGGEGAKKEKTESGNNQQGGVGGWPAGVDGGGWCSYLS